MTAGHENRQRLVVQHPVRADGATSVGVSHAVEVGETPARLFHDDLEGSQVPERHAGIDGDLQPERRGLGAHKVGDDGTPL